MAGRGVDIKLGEGVVEAGGLYVLGTERHESRRIDNQLRGRSGRQGDPGETRFYLSAEDELIRLFAGDRMYRILSRLGPKEGEPLEAKMLSNVVEKAQVKVEELNFMRRKNVLKYDEVMNEQRRVVYDQRQRILMGEDFGEQVREMVSELVEGTVRAHLEGEQYSEDWDLDSLFVGLRQIYDPAFKKSDIDLESATLEEVIELAVDDALAQYDERERLIGAEQMRSVERAVMLQVIDSRWKDHLLDMDYLQEGIHLRALGQRDPLVEYKGEGFDLFQDMMEGIKIEHRHDAHEEQPRGPRGVHGRHARGAAHEPQLHERRRPHHADLVHRRGHGRRRARGARRRRLRRRAAAQRGRRRRQARRRHDAARAPVAVQQRVVVRQGRAQRPVPVREREEVQEVSRGLSAAAPSPVTAVDSVAHLTARERSRLKQAFAGRLRRS